VWFEPAIPGSEGQQTNALDRAATGTGINSLYDTQFNRTDFLIDLKKHSQDVTTSWQVLGPKSATRSLVSLITKLPRLLSKNDQKYITRNEEAFKRSPSEQAIASRDWNKLSNKCLGCSATLRGTEWLNSDLCVLYLLSRKHPRPTPPVHDPGSKWWPHVSCFTPSHL